MNDMVRSSYLLSRGRHRYCCEQPDFFGGQ